MVSGNIQLCAGIEYIIEEEAHALGDRQRDKTGRRIVEEARDKAKDEEEETSAKSLTVKKLGMEEESVLNMGATVEMEVEGGKEG